MLPKPLRWILFLMFAFIGVSALSANTYRFLLSLSPDRSAGPYDLATFTISTRVYPYIDPPTGIQSVQFFLDDAAFSKPPFCTESIAPFDCMGTAKDGSANPLDLAALAPGSHVLTAKLKLTGGQSQVLTAKIEIPPKSTPTPAPTPKPGGFVKWHPGHYVYTQKPVSGSVYDAVVDRALLSPHLAGVQVRVMWNRDGIEPRKGVYDTSRLENLLARYQAKGKRIAFLMMDQDYWGLDCVPDYMRNPKHPDYDPAYKGGQVKQGTRCVPKIWVPAVMDRLIAYYSALGARFDREASFEGLQTTEAALPALGDPDYSKAAMVAQLKRLIDALPTAFPHSLTWLTANWSPSTDAVVAYAYAKGVGISGPDLFVLGHKDPVQGPTWGYPCYNQALVTPSVRAYGCSKDYFGLMPLAIAGQVGLEASIADGYTMDEIFDFAVTNPKGLRVSHLFWSQAYQTPGFNFLGKILPFIESRKGAIANTACPDNLKPRGGCGA